jgi:AcrR family transcriptional regulator
MAGKNDDKIIAAARHVFMRYGFRRATMGEIATAAGMSRAALYLVYPSKEDVLTAVVTRMFAAMLDEIRHGLGRFATAEEQLTFALDVWCVTGFELVQASPDAKDLYESSYQFAAEVTATAAADFVALVADVLDPLVRQQATVALSSVQIAQVLVSAMPGFKGSVTTTEQFRAMIARLITIVLASLDNPTAPAVGSTAGGTVKVAGQG